MRRGWEIKRKMKFNIEDSEKKSEKSEEVGTKIEKSKSGDDKDQEERGG